MGFILGDEAGSPGDTVAIGIKVENFIAISGYQGTVRWDTAAVDFIDWSSSTPGITNIFGQPGQGLIPLDGATFTWVNFSGGSTTLADSSEVMRIRFEIKANAASGTYPVLMNGSVTNLGYSDGTSLITPTVVQGSVTVAGCVSNFDASFSFPLSVCPNSANPQAVITGDLGGTFSVNGGASIDPVTGVLDLNSTTLGTSYQVTYTVGISSNCPAVVSKTIQILNNDDASFSITDTICINATNPTAVISGLTGGSFSVDNGASINQSTGELDLLSTVAGSTYQITYNTNGPCPNQSAQSVFVQAVDNASFSLTDTVCVFGVNPIPTISGQTGGTFSVDQGANIDASTGELFLSSLTAGTTYNISYQTAGDCPSSSSQSIFVSGLADASFSYPTSACPNGINPSAIVLGLSGGVFSVAPSGNVNPATGELDLNSVSPGVYTITYSLNDICQSSSQQQIIVGDNVPPDNLILPTLIGECSVTAPIVSTTDNCVGTVTGTTNDPLIYNTQGNFTINWTFDDGNGNQISVSQSVIVLDLTAPNVVCNDLTITLGSNGMASILPSQIDNGSTDNCGIANISLSQSNFSAANIGQNAVTLYVTDIAGNIDSCSATVTVTNTLPPVAVCQDIAVYLDDMGQAAINATDLDGGSTVNVGTPQLSVSQDSFSCADLGNKLISLFVADSLGAIDTCIATVSVLDTIAPMVVCQDLSVMLDNTAQAIIMPSMVDNGSSDACGILSLSLSQDTFGATNIGQNTVTLYVTDLSGNIDSCLATITVNNALPPVAICQDLSVYLDDMGQAAISATDLDGGSTVNVGNPQLSIDQDSFSCADVGPNLISLIVTDSLGAADTCVAVVSVLDTIAPIVICQDLSIMLDSTGQAVIDPAMVDNGSADACGILNLSLSQDTFGVADVGTQTVTLFATDNNGNIDSCQATISIQGSNSIEDPLAASLQLQVYPNPFEDHLTIDWYSIGFGEISIEVLNPLGQILHRETKLKASDRLQTQLEMNDLPEGMYIVRIQQEGYFKSISIIKQ